MRTRSATDSGRDRHEVGSNERTADAPQTAPRSGSQGSFSVDVDSVVAELRTIAQCFLARERRDHTLQATAIVNELWLRVLRRGDLRFASKNDFLAYAATAVRHILVDSARRRRAAMRGGNRRREPYVDDAVVESPLSDAGASIEDRLLTLPELDEELRLMEIQDSDSARVFELRYFGGMRLDAIAGLLGVSDRTVRNRWNAARFWLRQRLDGR